MNPRALRTLLVERIRSYVPARFKHADRALGVEGAPQTMISPAWDVVLGGSIPLPQRQRGQTRRRQEFRVRTLHSGVLTKGQDQWNEALDDEVTIRRALQRTVVDDLAQIDNTIVDLGAADPTMLMGGTYRLGAQTFHIDFTDDLPE